MSNVIRNAWKPWVLGSLGNGLEEQASDAHSTRVLSAWKSNVLGSHFRGSKSVKYFNGLELGSLGTLLRREGRLPSRLPSGRDVARKRNSRKMKNVIHHKRNTPWPTALWQIPAAVWCVGDLLLPVIYFVGLLR